MIYINSEVLGPCVGSILVDVYDFPLAITVIGLLNLATALLLLCSLTLYNSPKEIPCSKTPLLNSTEDSGNVEHTVGTTASVWVPSEREPISSGRDIMGAYGSTY